MDQGLRVEAGPAPEKDRSVRAAAPRVAVAIAASLAVVLALALAAALQLRAHIYAERAEDAARAVRLVEEHAEKVIGGNLAMLGQVEWQVREVGWDKAVASPALHEWLRRIAEASNGVIVNWLIDAAGAVRAASFAPLSPYLNLADRDYFLAAARGERDFVSAVVFGRASGLYNFSVGRRLEDRQGAFLGVVLASIYPSYFEKVYGSIGPEADAVMLLRTDGALLARHPRPPGDLATLAAGPDFMARLDGQSGVFTGAAPFAGGDFLLAYRRLETLPLYVVYGIAVGTVEAAWRRILLTYALFAVPALLAAAALGAFAFRQARGVDRAHAALSAANAGLEARVAARTEALALALGEKDVLLREVHHRVKNNLQVIGSLVRMSARRAAPDSQPAFADLARRVWAIGRIHSQIYGAPDLASIALEIYLKELCEQVARSERYPRARLSCTVEPVTVDLDIAVPLALIVVELMTNAYKYAFPDGRAGTLSVGLARQDGHAVLTVRDDGVGMDPARTGGTGLRLVEMLALQLKGRLDRADIGGAAFTLTFPTSKPRPSARAA